MIDTNVLCDWMASVCQNTQTNQERLQRSKNFCELNKNSIYIPDIVWIEFLSVFLQKDIDVSIDLNSTRQWIMKREAFVNQLELAIQELTHLEWFKWNANHAPYPDAERLVRGIGLINQSTFNGMYMRRMRNIEKIENGEKRPPVPPNKLLDGMDSVILVYLNKLASDHPEKQILFYTGDLPLWGIVPRLKRYHNKWFSQNIWSFNTIFPKVRCSHCHSDNPHDILHEQEIVCQKCNRMLYK